MFLLISSYIADLLFGDPEWLPHPVRWMGKLINILDSRLRGRGADRLMGSFAGLIVIGISIALSYLIITAANRLNPLAGALVWVYLAYTTISMKDLKVKSSAILKELKKESIENARNELSKIVGRDTHRLDKKNIVRATIESVAEGTNDGIVAPLFYLIMGGPVLAMAYKAISTLDSMLGYKNEKYLRFGWFSAKLDDVANFIPARISGFLIAIISGSMSFLPRIVVRGKFQQQSTIDPRLPAGRQGFRGDDRFNSFKIMLRDGRKHPSPNSGIPEAAMAGALGIRLGGPSTYQGKVFEKPYLGEYMAPIRPSLINEALKISLATSLLMVLIGATLKCVL